MPKNIELSKSQLNAKAQMIKKLEDELKDLEFKVKHEKLAAAKIKFIKSQLIVLRALKYFSPYIFTTLGVTVIFSALGGTPFYRDNVKSPLQTIEYIDTYGVRSYEQKYDSNAFEVLPVKYYEKWEKVENGYSRKVRIYTDTRKVHDLAKSIKKMTTDEIIEKLIEYQDISIDELFDSEYALINEFKNEITEEELNTEPYIEVTKCSKDSNDFIVMRESSFDNSGNTLLWVVLTGLTNVITALLYNEARDHNFSYYVEQIKERYPEVKIDSLVKKLEIKRKNYERLTR